MIESFVLREGTDYGRHETTLDDKVAQVLAQLRAGKAHIVFDPMLEQELGRWQDKALRRHAA